MQKSNEILHFMFFIKHICGEACFSSEGTNSKSMGEILRFMFFIKHICGKAYFSSEGTDAKIHSAATKVCPIRKT